MDAELTLVSVYVNDRYCFNDRFLLRFAGRRNLIGVIFTKRYFIAPEKPWEIYTNIALILSGVLQRVIKLFIQFSNFDRFSYLSLVES